MLSRMALMCKQIVASRCRTPDRQIWRAVLAPIRRPVASPWSNGWLRLQRPDLLERECDGFWDEVSDIVAEGCDLANTGCADEHELQIAHQIHLLDLWSHVL